MKDKNKTSSKPKGGKKKAETPEPPQPETTGKKKRVIPQMNPEARKSVTSSSSWTGKLPATLLHEHCQKIKWEKVTFDMVCMDQQL